jgi:hypothetical protein
MKNNDRDPTLCRAFISTAKVILAEHPEVKHSWSIDDDEDHCILDIPKQSEHGFDITVEVYPHEIAVSTDGPHVHFDDVKHIGAAVQEALGLVRDLLSPTMRVVKYQSNGQPYKWCLESLRDGKWYREDTMGILFYNFFGRRSTIICQNHVLPGRI